MSKILAIADVHIHDYPHRNPTPMYRLYQGSRIVSKNILDVAKKEGCEYLALCGDIIEKSIIRPYVMAEVYGFLHTVASGFKEVYIIWGNHDQDNKSSDQDITDSCLGLFLPPNVHYMHQKTITIDGTLIGFNNWQPEIDLSWIQGKVDILFTHARICYTQDSDLYQSQYLDESKFDIAFCGDIHKPGTIGKYVSIGIPQRCKMSDGEACTGVVVDCQKKSWEYTNLNPSDNLMKFQYTSSPELEGWNSEKGVWSIYKPDTSEIIDPTAGIKVSGWEKIESLVDDAIRQAGLQEIHKGVLGSIKNIDAGEVDFNFVPISFHCKNWRSIDEVTMYFNEGDKILIQGENGSGKSSLLSAIKYAFCDTKSTPGLSSLKPFIQFGTKDCMTEIEFWYQGNKCKIRRGTKDYGLWINDEPLKYSCKGDFEKDCRLRFPFIEYMEVMIHDQDHNQFIGNLSGERLAEIISKAFKLDRIDTYNETAEVLLDSLQKDSSGWISKIEESKKLLGFIESKLGLLVLPKYSKEELLYRKNEGLEMQRKNSEWNQFLSSSSRLQATIDRYTEDLEGYRIQSAKFQDPNIIDTEISSLRTNLGELQEKLVQLGGIRNQISQIESEKQRVGMEGSKLKAEFQGIDPDKTSVCPTCGQIIPVTSETKEALGRKKKELWDRLQEKANEFRRLTQKLEELKATQKNSSDEYEKINSEINQVNFRISELLTQKNYQSQVQESIKKTQKSLEDMKKQLLQLGAPPRVELPEGFMSKMSEIETSLGIWDSWESLQKDKLQEEQKISEYEKEIQGNLEISDKLKAYIKLTGPTGVIYKEIMEKLVSQFNDNLVNYEVDVREFRKVDHLTLIPQYFNNGNWISYEACSGGQKTVLDIHFLSKIISRIGILILDEFLKHLDPSNHDICLEMISGMSIGCTFISSHMESIQAFNNKTCKLSLNSSGLTQIQYE